MPYIKKTIEGLKKNNMNPVFVGSKEEVWPVIKSMLPENAIVANGGSATLAQCGVITEVRKGPYRFLDRHAPGLTAEEMHKIFVQSLSADVYLSSANAITENGELYNVDGNSNRVAALSYGPEKVIIVAGVNKIVPTLSAAAKRVKYQAAPANTRRLGKNTYCREKGVCVRGDAAEMCAGCTSPDRICCNYLVSAYQRHQHRMHVILVGEELGF